jgi:hypothetical protein
MNHPKGQALRHHLSATRPPQGGGHLPLRQVSQSPQGPDLFATMEKKKPPRPS